jgi:ABC-2 type transport system permease protein
MSETIARATASRAPHEPATALRRARAVLATEWIKLRSLRPMLYALLLTAVFCIGLSALACSNNVANWAKDDAATKAAFDPLFVSLNFVQVGIILFGVIGALVATNEYGNGLIRATFAATPQRGLILAAKAILVALLGFVVAVVTCFTAFFIGQAILSSGHLAHVSLGDPGVLGRVTG